MQLFVFLAFLVVIVIAVFAVQNSGAPHVTMSFLIWQFETSLVYAILGAIGSGMLIVLLLCIPRVIRSSFSARNLRREIESLKRETRYQKEGEYHTEKSQPSIHESRGSQIPEE